MATLISKSSHGPPSRHILASQGPPKHPMNFYSTTYSTIHSNKRYRDQPSVTLRHKGTGYIANFRPTIYYNKKVDQTDNPSMADAIEDNYRSLTTRDYVPLERPGGRGHLPLSLHHSSSGYSMNQPITCAHSQHLMKSKTSYTIGYYPKEFRRSSLHPSHHTNKEYSGFSHSINIEPITYREHHNYTGAAPIVPAMGQTLMKTDYNRTLPLSGCESVPNISNKTISNGYITGNHHPSLAQPTETQRVTVDDLHKMVTNVKRKQDPAIYTTLSHPHPYTPYSKVSYRKPDGVHPHASNEFIGRKEISGYSDNTHPPKTTSNPSVSQSLTQNNYKRPLIHDVQPSDPNGSTTDRKLDQPNGYTKSTAVHSDPKPNKYPLAQRDSYVGRSVLDKDRCYYEDPYKHKIKS